MRFTRPLLALGLLLLLTGVTTAQPKPQELILGKWIMSVKEGDAEFAFAMEFTKDNKLKGDVSATVGGKTNKESFDGTYKFLDDKTLEVTAKNKAGKEETNKVTIKSITDKEMILVDDKKMDLKFTRAAK